MTHGRAAAILVAALLQGCTPLGAAVGVGATAGLAASEERGVGGALSDARIQADINDVWLRHSIEMLRRLELTVYDGRVLIAGFAADARMKADAVRLAAAVPGVRGVEDRVVVGPEPGSGSYVRDMWIAGALRTKLTFDSKIQAVNYTIECVNGEVYLMGMAQSAAELERVVAHASRQRYVKAVHSLVNIKVQTATPTSTAGVAS